MESDPRTTLAPMAGVRENTSGCTLRALLTSSATDWTAEEVNTGLQVWAGLLAASGFVFLPALLMILFRRKYPAFIS